jgi:uncharacterized membrane protein
VSAGLSREHLSEDRHGLERLVFFTDAVVAIAITLVALPLVDSARQLGDHSAATFLRENMSGLIAAGISFVVISEFWRDHHRLFVSATGYTRTVIRLNLLWLGGIVALPVATILDVSSRHADRVALALYLGTIVVLMITARAEELLLARDRLLREERFSARLLLENAVPVALMLIALVAAMIMPQWGLWPVLVLVAAQRIRLLVTGARPILG